MNKVTVTAEPGSPIITIERMFDAPRDKVFAALTTKEKVEKWWLGPGNTVEIKRLDARTGGSWEFVQTSPDGQKFGFFGTYHEVSPERTIQTFEFDGLPERGHVSTEKMELTEMPGGKTKLHTTSVFFSVTDRDGMLQSGMEGGLNQTYDALDKVLAVKE